MLRSVRVFAIVLLGLGTRPVIAQPITVMSRATGSLTQTFSYSQNDFVFDKVNGYDVVTLVGLGTRSEFSANSVMSLGYSTTEPGNPNLPLAVYNVLIPPDAEITGVTVTDENLTTIAGTYSIHPSQRPRVLSKPALPFVEPDDRTYGTDRTYPTDVVSFSRSGVMGGFRVAGIQVAPLRYNPVEKRLELATRMSVRVDFERNRNEVLALEQSQIDLVAQNLPLIVRNPEQAAVWAPAVRETDDWLCDMMVITSSSLAASFQPFAAWKTRRGIKTVIVKTDSIYSTYAGRDNQEKIRACVKDYWQNHGLKWLLVGGDNQIVPVRTCYLTVEGITEEIASDMYYADLQYSWDSNHNNEFGEMDDTVDLFYDVYVGRTPVDNSSDVATFFAKDTMFEKHQDTTRLKRVLFGSTMLFDPYHGKVINHIIADEFPTGWTHAHLEDPNSGVYADSMSSGFQLAHVAAHGNPYTFSVMDDYEVAGLTNGLSKLNYVSSIACQSGWFDNDECLAEALVKAANGGCVACMLNSRYGFGYPPGFGPSEMLDLQFYRYLNQGYATQFGTLGMLSKDYYQSMAMGQEAMRWCVFELNLFGDPTLHVYTEKPRTLAVTKPDSACVGTQVLRITVKDGSTPIKGALVCLAKGTETYARGWTNGQGWIDLLASPTTTGNLTLSASCQNYYPYDGTVPVRGNTNAPALVFAGLRIDDGGNGRLDPGETANLFVTIKNAGATDATGVDATLRTSCPWLTLLDSTASYGRIAAGASVEGDAFQVTASAGTPTGTLAGMVAACVSAQGNWQPYFETRIGDAPPAKKLWADHDTSDMILSVTSVGSVGTLGPYREGTGLKYPRNAPYGSLYFTSFACGNSASYVVDRWYGHPTSTFQTDWRPVETLYAVIAPVAGDEEYRCVINDSNHATPKGLFVTQWSASVADPGYRDFVVITYKIENRGADPINGLYAGIFSDFDINNTTDNRVFSDTVRRLTYMAEASDFQYSAGVKLLSPTTAANLSAIDHNVYVTPSGMMTEAVKDSFLRGAIRRRNSNGTRNWSCVVSAGPFDIEAGGRAFAAFAFVGGDEQQLMLAHADSAQHWFDRSVAVADDRGVTAPDQVEFRVLPSMVSDRARVRFVLPRAGRAMVEVLDVEGRLVKTLAGGEFAAGAHVLSWDGCDEQGRIASSGVYVCRLRTESGTVNRKAVIVK